MLYTDCILKKIAGKDTHMFGYIIVNQEELKLKEYHMYRSYYCGLCQVLKEKYGMAGQMTLTYDLTFLILLLSDLYQDTPTEGMCRCIAHPFEKHPTRISRFSDYAADMNVLFSYYQCQDDWNDEKKLSRKAGSVVLKKDFEKIVSRYPEKAAIIENWLVKLHTYEKNHSDNIDEAAGCFGQILAEIFVWQKDEWEQDLRQMGFFLGKFIYLMDAYEDLEKDEKNQNYNPLLSMRQEPDFESYCHQLLTMMLAEACKSFERLPLADNVSILRNILYSGVWSHYELINLKRKEKNNHV
jgi:hypothetical protein